jgi:hypothetical protein
LAVAYQQYLQNYFGGDPAKYAEEIKRKRQAGISLTDPTAAAEFEKAYPQYFQQTTQQTTANVQATTPPQSPIAEPTIPSEFRVKPYEPSDTMKRIISRIEDEYSRLNVAPNDIINSPEWQAQQKVLDLQKGEAQSALRRSMASRGMLRSTPAVQALAGEEARFEAARSAALPQMMQAEYARRAGNLAELMRQAQLQAQVEQTGYERAAREAEAARMFPLQEAQVTGAYLPGMARGLAERILDLKAQAKQPGADVASLKQQADAYRDALARYIGNDAYTKFGSDVTYEQAAANLAGLGAPTLKTREAAMSYQEAMQKLAQQNAEFQVNTALKQAALNLDSQRLAQDADWRGWLEDKGTTEMQSEVATNKVIADIAGIRNADDAYKYIAKNVDKLTNAGVNLSKVLQAFRTYFPDRFRSSSDIYLEGIAGALGAKPQAGGE